MQATARIYFQKAPAKRTVNNLCPAKLCVTHNRIRKYYSLNEMIQNDDWLFLSDSDIEKVTGTNPRGKYRDIAFEYKRIVKLAEDIINGIPVFSFGLFDAKFFNKVGNWNNVFFALIEHIKLLKLEGRFGYAESFQSTLRAVKEFQEGKKLRYNSRDKVELRFKEYESGRGLTFQDITATWLKRFDKHLKENKKSVATIGIYMRNLRRLFNIALAKHKIKAEYPFSEYTPKRGGDRKLALSPHQIFLIASYKTDDPRLEFYRDIFIFSFMANGMNISDIARLKYSDVKRGEIVFVRQKTGGKEIQIPITNRMQKIIDRHGNKAVGHDAFIFPILRPEWDDRKKYYQARETNRLLNDSLKQIATAVGITERVSSYVARHSFSTILKNAGASVEYIKEALGHSSVHVTEAYLKSFEGDTRREHSELLEGQVFKTDAG